MKKHNILLIVIIPIIFNSCSSNLYLNKIPTNEIKVDGNIDDWSGDLKYIKDENSAIGVKNDKDNLYICFTTSDRKKIRHIINLGLTVWLKPVNSKTLGVHYPINSLENNGFDLRSNNPRIFQNDITYKKYMENNRDFLIVNEENFPLYGLKIGFNSGYWISLGFQNGQFIYELAVPFIHTTDHYIPIIEIPENKLGITFETGDGDFNLISNKKFSHDNSRIGDGSDAFGGRRTGNKPFLSSGIDEKIDVSITANLQ